MADAYEYVESTGVVIADTGDTQAQVEAEYRAVFGQALVVTPNTPQGVLIAAEVTQRQGVARNNAALANQINPNLAGGVFLDAIWSLTGGARIAATKSTIAGATVSGVAGTLIPAGSQAATGAGAVFATAGDVTIGAGGTASVDFIAVDYGPTPANAGTLTVIVSAVLGWETVTNPTGAVLGQDQESDVASRIRRRNTLALQGVALPEAIISGLYDTAGVSSLQFRENPSDVANVIDTIAMDPHSIYVCVQGGTDADVAATILARKSLGAKMMGAVTVNVTDAASGQVYAVKFSRPTPVPIIVRVTAKNINAVGDPSALIKASILNYAAGLVDGERGLVVGVGVSPFELAGAVNRDSPGLYVQKCEVATAASGVFQTTELAIAVNELATLNDAGISVVLL